MSGAMALVCRVAPSAVPDLRWTPVASRSLGADEVRVRVHVAGVNPIDVKRAAGYGRRVLSLLGAGGDELVLGNDFAGVVEEVGRRVRDLSKGDRVWGLVPTGGQGAHRTDVCVSTRWVRRLDADVAMVSAAALPYTFTTLWRALGSIGLDSHSARNRHVLVHGGGGALGQLAIQLLSRWGARVTAVCGPASRARCLALGASAVVDRRATRLADLPANADATLNFGTWADEADLIGRLQPRALGHATTVHPLLGDIDAHGWVAGGWRCWQAWRAMNQRLKSVAPEARYAWTVFQPDESAMNALQASFAHQPLVIEVSHLVPVEDAARAFSHVGQGHSSRAVLTVGS